MEGLMLAVLVTQDEKILERGREREREREREEFELGMVGGCGGGGPKNYSVCPSPNRTLDWVLDLLT